MPFIHSYTMKMTEDLREPLNDTASKKHLTQNSWYQFIILTEKYNKIIFLTF